MKHICFFTLSMQRGGAEGVIARLCNDFLRRYYKISIITCMDLPIEQELSKEIDVICLEEGIESYANKIDRFLKRRKKLREVLKELRVDLFISFLPEPNFIALSLKKEVNFPILFSLRNDPKKEYGNLLYRIMMYYYYPKADGVVFQTKEARDYFSFSRKLLNHSAIIANPIGTDYMNLEASQNRNNVIVTVGRLDHQKNQTMLIKAFAELVKVNENLKLEIYGEGPLKEELGLLIQKMEMSQKISLCGNVPNIRERIRDSRIFVLCSDYEGIPNSLMEALAMGIPSIATDCPCGGPKFLIQNRKNGILIPLGDQERLVKEMQWILDHEEEAERMAQSAIEDIKKIYPEKIYKEWQDFISRYIGE